MSHTDGPSVPQQIRNLIQESGGAASYQKLIENTDVGDYDGLANELTYNVSQPLFFGGEKLGTPGTGGASNDVVSKANQILGNPEEAIPSSVQKKLGQDPGDTDIDDIDDIAKAVGPSNLSVGGVIDRFRSTPDNFEGSLPGPDPDNSTMNQELENGMGTAKRVKSVIENNTSLIIVTFFILGAIGVSLGPLDFE